MLSVHNITKSYGITPVLQNISFNLNAAEKTGLVASNVCAKDPACRDETHAHGSIISGIDGDSLDLDQDLTGRWNRFFSSLKNQVIWGLFFVIYNSVHDLSLSVWNLWIGL